MFDVIKTAARPFAIARWRPLNGAEAVQRILAFGALFLLIIFFSLWSPYFFNFDNFDNILIATSVVGVLALGETLVIVTGGIELSIGTVITVAAVLRPTALDRWGLPAPVGVLVGIAQSRLRRPTHVLLAAR